MVMAYVSIPLFNVIVLMVIKVGIVQNIFVPVIQHGLILLSLLIMLIMMRNVQIWDSVIVQQVFVNVVKDMKDEHVKEKLVPIIVMGMGNVNQ
jgi:hypothetical protein